MKEKETSMIDARKPSREAYVKTFLMFSTHLIFNFLPLDTKRWISKEVIKSAARVTVVREAIAANNMRGILALEHHIRAANRISLVVQFLPEDLHSCMWVQRAQVVLSHREHSTGAAGSVEAGRD